MRSLSSSTLPDDPTKNFVILLPSEYLCSIYEKYATAKSTTHNTHITMPNSILFIIVPAVACALPQFEQTGCPFSI